VARITRVVGSTIELSVDCGFVHATDDVVTAWNYDDL
jgi:hypothetical protein